MIPLTPNSTLTDTLCPYTTLFRSDRPLVEAVSRGHRGGPRSHHGPPDRLAARQHPARRRDGNRSWRLPHRQYDLSPDGATHRCGARLGTVDARPSARGFRLQRHDVPYAAASRLRAGRRRSRRTSHSFRPRLHCALLRANRPGFPSRIPPTPHLHLLPVPPPPP